MVKDDSKRIAQAVSLAALIVSIVSVCVSITSLERTSHYQHIASDVQRAQFALQKSQFDLQALANTISVTQLKLEVEESLHLSAFLDDDSHLIVKVTNGGAPTTLEMAGFEYPDPGNRPNMVRSYQPAATRTVVPRRLERFESVRFDIGPGELSNVSKGDREKITGFVVLGAAGTTVRLTEPDVMAYVKAHDLPAAPKNVKPTSSTPIQD